MTRRYLADPPSRTGGILTKRELDAALRVLAALRRPQPAQVVMSWDNDMQDILGGLQRARYVESRPAYGGRAPKASASFKPDILATTDLGSEYLDSIQQPLTAPRHATKRTGKAALRTLNLYHRTTPEKARAIYQRGFSAGHEQGTVFFSTFTGHESNAQGSGYGEAVVHVRVPKGLANLDDEFPSGERHYWVRYTDLKPEHYIPYATKKKTPAQLQSEIDAALAGGSKKRKGAVRHATKKQPLRVAYRLQLSPSELRALDFARGRYEWPDMLLAHVSDGGLVAFTEPEMWQWADDVDSDDSPFTLAAGPFAEKLQRFYDERI